MFPANRLNRLTYGTSCRLTRTAPEETRQFQDWSIPAGVRIFISISRSLANSNQTPISMSSLMMHHNEKIFPQSYKFLPERWSERDDGGKSLERYMVSFSKGSRQCIGMGYVILPHKLPPLFPFLLLFSLHITRSDYRSTPSFAKAEIYLTVATIFSRYANMRLFDTDFDRDIKMASDMFFPQPCKESRGVRVVFG